MNLPISIRGARQHNLRNLDLDLPSNKLIVFCGPSGSGKSSLAFDTLFSESRRRFLDCLSARSRQGMDQPEKPEVDSITGLPPALCLEQSARQQSSRTLLGSITEILYYLRILYAAAGTPHDPETGKELERKSPDRITEELVSLPEHTRLILAAPAENLLAQDPAATLGDFQRQGFRRLPVPRRLQNQNGPAHLRLHLRPQDGGGKKDDGAGHRNHPRGKHLDTGVSGRNAYGG